MYPIRLAVFIVLLLTCTGSFAQDEGGTRFVGLSQSKALFAIMVQGSWEYVFNYCHNYRMFAASIDNESENELVANYLNRSAQIDSFWLPATDYINEGTFAWIRTKTPVLYANWAAGYPSVNRSRNCVAIRKDGTWIEESCISPESARTHYGLCELPLLNHNSVHEDVRTDQAQTQELLQETASQQISLEQAKVARLVPIGGVGSKLYFKDETLTSRKQFESLEFCHELGMRLVSPQTPAEFEFLGNYSRQMENNGENALIFTSGSDMLATGCNRGNAMYRWFYSPEQVGLDGALPSHWWHKCIVIIPGGIITPDCFGMGGWTACELEWPTNAART